MAEAVRVGFGVALRWAVLYLALSFVTQLWAGSQYSEGQGGGFGELMKWSVIFGVIAVVVAAERAASGVRIIEPKAVMIAAVIGQVIGTGVAIAWFSSKGGPGPNDWWIAPAVAAVAVALWCHLLAPRRAPGPRD